VKETLDWGALAPLRLRARTAAEGLWVGPHKSLRKGAGVEFAGYRAYVAGDDLRFLDRHALMRHGTRVVREFETDTDRSVRLVLDTSASMGFAGARSPGPKLAFAAVVAAALGWVVLRGGDRIALDWLGEGGGTALPWGAGSLAFERLASELERVVARGGVEAGRLSDLVARVGRRSPAGSITVVLSDFLDLPANALEELSSLSSRSRGLVGVQVLDRDELDLPFAGPVRLRALEQDLVVDTDAPRARAAYQAALEEHTAKWREGLVGRGARFIRAATDEAPVAAVRRLLDAILGVGP
jgi:uncharacterized protein (DUF58 family)